MDLLLPLLSLRFPKFNITSFLLSGSPQFELPPFLEHYFHLDAKY